MLQVKICFLSLASYPTLTGKNMGYAGGAEVEQVHLGAELTALGHDVCFVTYSDGLERIERVCGIQVIKTYCREKASEISFVLKFKSIWSALETANADIYFHEAGSIGVLPLFCYVHRKKFVHRIASDTIVLGKPLTGRHSFSENLRARAAVVEVKTADAVIAQSKFQELVLKERFGVESVLIKNGLIVPQVDCEKTDPLVVLWVGSLSRIKNPKLFVELAKSLSNVRCEMIGGRGDPPQLYDEIAAVSRKLLNLKFHGFVPYNKVNEYFRRASIFVNTSSMEGFPNTFIQAWAHYTPVVSLTVDPDSIIQNEKLGFVSGTFRQLLSDVNTLLQDEKLRVTMGENARKYVEREHDVRKTVKEYIEIFSQLLA